MLKKFTVLIFLIVLLFSVALCSGCTNTYSTTSPGGNYFAPPPTPVPKPQLHISSVNSDSDWSLSKGCYWTATYQIYNTGDGAAKNVYLTVSLVNANTGYTRDSETRYIGTLSPGASQIVSVTLDGECSQRYHLKASYKYD